MPHIIDQCKMGIGISDNYGASKKNIRVISTPAVDDPLHSSTRCFFTPPASSTSARFTKTPQQTNYNLLPTPVSSISIVFESPEKSSPSTLLSPADSIVAELEDTSPGYRLQELEDTSEVATKTFRMSSRDSRGGGGTSQRLVTDIARHFSNLEQENLQLRASLRTMERNLAAAKETVADARRAFSAVEDSLTDREYEVEYKKSIIAELEKEVEHCRNHHLPPPPPSKSEIIDPLVSRFNVNAKRTTLPHPPPSTIIMYRTSSVTAAAESAKSLSGKASSVTSSAAGDRYDKLFSPTALTAPEYYVPLMSRSPSAASELVGKTQKADESPISHIPIITPLGFEGPITPRPTNPLSMHPVEARAPAAGHSHDNLRPRDNSARPTLLSPKSSPDLRRGSVQGLSFPSRSNAAGLTVRQNDAKYDSQSQHSSTYASPGSYSSTSSTEPLITSQTALPKKPAAPLVYQPTRGVTINPPAVYQPKRGASITTPAVYQPTRGVVIPSPSYRLALLGDPPSAVPFSDSGSPNPLGALSTLPSQLRARANSSGASQGPDGGQGVSRTPIQEPRQRSKRNAVSGIFRGKDGNASK